MRISALLTATLIASATPVRAQAPAPALIVDSARAAIETAVELGDLRTLEAAIALIDRGLEMQPDHLLLRHYHGYALYRAGSMMFGQQGSGKARPYFDQASQVLELLTRNATIPETYGVLASVYGMQIATSRVSMVAGIRLGPKVNELMARALATGPNNPRVWVLRGINAFNTPSSFGGGMDNAETYLKKALELFSRDTTSAPLPAWGLADAHIWLGQVYARRENWDAARAEYQAALAVQPRHAWVRQTLLPGLKRPD